MDSEALPSSLRPRRWRISFLGIGSMRIGSIWEVWKALLTDKEHIIRRKRTEEILYSDMV